MRRKQYVLYRIEFKYFGYRNVYIGRRHNRMSEVEVINEIQTLIDSHAEGDYWDFKETS